MHHPDKNSFLQLVVAMNPRVINKAVDQAMQKETDIYTKPYPAQRLESMQPSLFAPHVDITRAHVGFERTGLKLLVRELHSPNYLVQLQAIHSIMDRVQISEEVMFLLDMKVVYRLIDLLHYRNPVIREKVCIILNHLAYYQQGRQQIMSRPEIVEYLLWLILRDRKEIRYAAANTLRTLSREQCSCEVIVKCPNLLENLLKVVINDFIGIVILVLRTLENLMEWDPVPPLKLNAFQVVLSLFHHSDPRITCAAMDCITQLLQDDVGRELADINDITFVLRPFLLHEKFEVIISAVALMKASTLTTRSKWRAKECINDLSRVLVKLCHSPNKPMLQLFCLQILINLCDCPDVRNHLKAHWEKRIKAIKIRTHEEWDGTTETTSFGFEYGHHYRSLCIEKVETIKNEFGDSAQAVNVHSYQHTVRDYKHRLLKAINWKSYHDTMSYGHGKDKITYGPLGPIKYGSASSLFTGVSSNASIITTMAPVSMERYFDGTMFQSKDKP